MKANEFIDPSMEEGIGRSFAELFFPKALTMWLHKKLNKKQFDELLRVYEKIMQNEIAPPKSPQEALYRAAKTVGLDQRMIHDMFGEKGIPGEI